MGFANRAANARHLESFLRRLDNADHRTTCEAQQMLSAMAFNLSNSSIENPCVASPTIAAKSASLRAVYTQSFRFVTLVPHIGTMFGVFSPFGIFGGTQTQSARTPGQGDQGDKGDNSRHSKVPFLSCILDSALGGSAGGRKHPPASPIPLGSCNAPRCRACPLRVGA